jgi:hypothetical protein
VFPPQGIPTDVDAVTHQRIARTFLVVRLVKGGLLLVFLLAFLVAIELKGWPWEAAALVSARIVLDVGILVTSWRRYKLTAWRSPRA